MRKRKKKPGYPSNQTPAIPALWRLICRRPTVSLWGNCPTDYTPVNSKADFSSDFFARDSHKKTPITAAAKAAARAESQKEKGARK